MNYLVKKAKSAGFKNITYVDFDVWGPGLFPSDLGWHFMSFAATDAQNAQISNGDPIQM